MDLHLNRNEHCINIFRTTYESVTHAEKTLQCTLICKATLLQVVFKINEFHALNQKKFEKRRSYIGKFWVPS